MENSELFEKQYSDNNTESEIKKCPSCGSNMVYSPEHKGLFCEHCGTSEKIEADMRVKELDIRCVLNSAETWQGTTNVFKCDNCGAKVVLDKNETADLCPFCGTAHVIKTEELPGLKPNALIPFLISKNDASSGVLKWIKSRVFAVRKFKREAKEAKMQGVYLPFFTFDSCTQSSYVGRIGKRRTRTVGSGNNRRTETYIEWYNIAGNYDLNFDDITINASNKISAKQQKKAGNFKREETCVYEEKYLLGSMAYHYEKDINTCWGEAQTEMDKIIRSSILSQYYYDVIDYLHVDTTHRNVTYKYLMLPMYTAAYRFKQKIYNIYVNGTTGKVFGKTPTSPLKVLGLIASILAVIGGIVAIVLLTGK